MPADRDLDTEIGSPKYAHVELERRFLVHPSARPDVADLDYTLIEDLYIEGTRLRLRRMIRDGGAWTACKLTKKYDSPRPEARPIVTAYLTEREFALFDTLPGVRLRKRRYHLAWNALCWSLDLFEGPLAGLELAEAEAVDETELAALVPPPWLSHEVTADPRYQCGRLAQLDKLPEELWPVS